MDQIAAQSRRQFLAGSMAGALGICTQSCSAESDCSAKVTSRLFQLVCVSLDGSTLVFYRAPEPLSAGNDVIRSFVLVNIRSKTYQQLETDLTMSMCETIRGLGDALWVVVPTAPTASRQARQLRLFGIDPLSRELSVESIPFVLGDTPSLFRTSSTSGHAFVTKRNLAVGSQVPSRLLKMNPLPECTLSPSGAQLSV